MTNGLWGWIFSSSSKEKKMTFQLKVAGINERDLIKLEGVGGPFYVRVIPSREELRGGMFYGDKNCQFFFYTTYHENNDGSYQYEIFKATTAPLSGGVPKIDAGVVRSVKENITLMFMTRDMNFPDRAVLQKDVPSAVEFTWELG